MANAFLPGQKLTAADLNAAIESVAGPDNPTSDSKWNQTKYGKLFKSWDAFRNSQNQTPRPLDVGIEFQIFPDGQTVNGLNGAKLRGQRQIFLNLGVPQTYQAGPIGIEEHALPIGKMNDCPFVGVLGYQLWSSNALVPGDDKIHFSLWGRWGLEPAGQDAANWELWKLRQKLYDVDTSRPFSPLHWWYTGISPERSAAISDWTLNIVATTAYIVCKKKTSVESDSHKYFKYPLLVVATQFDAIIYPALSSPALNASILQQVQACYGPALGIDVVQVEFDPTENWMTIATYNVAEKLQDASYKQQTNFAQFYSDHGAYSIKSTIGANSILLNKPQFIDGGGKHHELFDYAFVDTTDMEGEGIDPTNNVTMALVMCYDYGPQQASLSCISCDFTDQSLAHPGEDSVSALLAPFYEEHDDARLVWVKQPGAVGVQYFDRCPDFRKTHVDSSLSTLQEHGLSSIQEKDMAYIDEADGQQRQLSAKVYSLFDFDDSENVRNYNNGVDDPNLIDLVTRNREDENGDMFVEYMSLSSVLSSVGATIMSCDTEKTASYKSLDTVLSGDGAPYYQMHGFKQPEEVGCTTIVRFDDIDYSGNADWSFAGNEQFVVRVPDGCGGYEVNYKKFSITQEHERVDSTAPSTRGRSTQYSSYINDIGGCYQVLELYNFDLGCTTSLTPQQVSADSGNGILVRKNQGNAYNLEYMDFDSLDNFAKRYVGDSQLNPSTHAPTDNSISISWDTDDEVFRAELWRFRNGGQTANVEIHTDGCAYYWPQNSQSTSTGDDYILVKHVDGNGNAELQYKQLLVTMPDIDMTYYDNIISEHTSEIVYLSGVIDDLSGSLSGDYWESGGDSSTCYGESIGNSQQDTVIDLDYKTLHGSWRIDLIDSDSVSANLAYIGCAINIHNTYIEANRSYFDGQMQVRDSVTAGCGFYTGCTYVCPTTSYFDGTLTVEGCGIFNSNVNIGSGGYLYIGSTGLSEQQLQALLQLVNAPQQLHNL